MDNSNMGKIVGAIVVIAILVGGLFLFMGSDDDTDESAETTTNEQVEAETPETSNTIVDLAVATDDLSTLVAAVQAADLVETLADESAEFTVFAPTNAAFDALPEGTLDTLLEPANVEDLAAILTYHVVPSVALSTDLSDGMMLETVNGEMLEVSISDGVVKINDATVTTANVEASNGVVHIIDTVLLP